MNEQAWNNLRKQIDYHLKEDANLTDIRINYQLRIPKYGTRNFLDLSVKISD